MSGLSATKCVEEASICLGAADDHLDAAAYDDFQRLVLLSIANSLLAIAKRASHY